MTDNTNANQIDVLVNFVKDIIIDYCLSTDDISSLMKKCYSKRKLKKMLRRYDLYDIKNSLVDCEKYLEIDAYISDEKKLNNYLDKTYGALYNKSKDNLLEYPEKFILTNRKSISTSQLYRIKLNKFIKGEPLTEHEKNFLRKYIENDSSQ